MGFKEAINEYGKEITASFVYCGANYIDEQIISMNPRYEGSLLRTVMKCLDMELDCELLEDTCAIVGIAVAGIAVAGVSDDSVKNMIISPRLGVKAPGESEYHYIDFGTHLITEATTNEESKTISIVCYDRMLQSMIPYDLSIDFSAGVTVKQYLDAICDRLGWEKGYGDFHNCDVLVDEEKYDLSVTFRDVLDDIAEVSGGMIGFVGDELRVIYPTSCGEVITEDNLKSLAIGKTYGPINSVVLCRTPQEDNIYRQDTDSISSYGMTEIRVENNPIIDSHRDDFMQGICDALFGLTFTAYELESFGIGYINFGDLFTIQTEDGTEYPALMLSDDMMITQGITERCVTKEPEVTKTDYKAASSTDKLLNKTILRVDKQANEIAAIVSKTEELSGGIDGLNQTITKMAEVIIDSDSLDIKISEAVSGMDSFKTSTGYTFDQDGLNIHKDGEEMHNTLDNTGMYVRRDNEVVLEANNEGVKAVNLTARHYLIIGGNARFEDYSNGKDTKRTACFYVGG